MLFYATINRAVGLAILTFTQKQQITRLLDSVVVLRPNPAQTGHFGDVSPSQCLGKEKNKSNTTKAGIHQSKEMY